MSTSFLQQDLVKEEQKEKLDMVILLGIYLFCEKSITYKMVKKLEYMASKKAIYNILYLAYVFAYQSWYWCSCKKFQGYLLPNGEENYFYIWKFKLDYNIEDIFKRENPKKFIHEKRLK